MFLDLKSQISSGDNYSMSTEQTYQIKEKLAFLESQLISNTPNISTILREIHIQLKKDPEVVTLLTEEECSILVRGLKKQTNTEIATSALKSGAKKSLKQMTLGDL